MLTSATFKANWGNHNGNSESMSKARTQERPYHHGDLRRSVVKAALEILAETQSLEFSLRELARRAGVSHNAPYKHFADKRELLAAISAAGFEMLTKRMTREIAGLGNAREQLFAMLRAYIAHGVENPALYSLMFGAYLRGPDHGRPAIELVEGDKMKALMVGAIIAGGLGRAIPDTPRNERKIAGALLACWSLVHGLTLLVTVSAGALRQHPSAEMEARMTTRNDQDVTETEDAAFDSTLKIAGIVIGLVLIAVAAFWHFL